MYDVCNRGAQGNQFCYYDGPALPLDDDTAVHLLRQLCPALYNPNGESYTCCNKAQLLGLVPQFSQMQTVYKRCPSCLDNLRSMACHTTCDPEMHSYMQPVQVNINDQTMKRYVTELNVYFSSRYMEGLYNSCSEVALPALGKLALDVTCGRYTSSQCTPQRWFDFLGDPSNNPAAPLKVNFKKLDTQFLDYTAPNITIYNCHEPSSSGGAACSCVDCRESCPAPFQYPDSSPGINFTILGLDGGLFILSCVYLLIIIAVLIFKWKKRLSRFLCWKRKLWAGEQPRRRSEDHYPHPRLSCVLRLSVAFQHHLQRFFYIWGSGVARHPTLVLALSSWFVAVCCFGVQFLVITNDPVEIWAAPSSQARLEKDYFESRFQPFFRTEQIFLKAVDLPKIMHNISDEVIEFGPAFNKEFLLAAFDLQQKIETIPGLQEICFAPLSYTDRAENISQCTVQSIWGYFKNDINFFNQTSKDENNNTVNYLNQAYKCLKSPVSTDCLAPYGGPVEPGIAVGGFLAQGDEAYQSATALVITYLVNNRLEREQLGPALSWEHSFIDLLVNWSRTERPGFMEVAFRSEISVEEEIGKESAAEAVTILLSYLLMFLYVSLALGSYTSCTTLFVDSAVCLGLGGVAVVLAAVVCSIGLFGYFSIPTTLLTMEVIPFLLLAVGVDNMFLLVNENTKSAGVYAEPVECVAASLAHFGPSLLLTTLSEAACFAIGALSDMPAVRTFALYAMVAVLINFLLQITAFVAFMSLNTRRVKASRLEVCCCARVERGDNPSRMSPALSLARSFLLPAIFHPLISLFLVLAFVFWFCASLAMIPHLEPGLEQQLSMPEDSYLLKYFVMMDEVMSMGPPVYFVLKPGLDLSLQQDQDLVCGALRCRPDSVTTQIYTASKQPDRTYLRTGASSWLDDFFDWASVPACCKVYKNGTFCPHSASAEECVSCNISLNEDGMRPRPDSFNKFVPSFLKDNPDPTCAKAGHPAYGQGVSYVYEMDGGAAVTDSYFMAYHSTLKTSRDYYMALSMARAVAANITAMLNMARTNSSTKLQVFPYSVFYVYYEQYLTIWGDTLWSLASSLAAVWTVTFLLTGFDLVSSLIVLVTVLMIVADLTALMYWWDINLNAVTLVNLVVAVGIAVEFCSHIVHAFVESPLKTRKLRAEDALLNTGSSVFAGITLTKILGIIVLAFSKTKIFRVFYFRMYLGMVLFGAAHGLIFLPILLSYLGTDNTYRIMMRNKRMRKNVGVL